MIDTIPEGDNAALLERIEDPNADEALKAAAGAEIIEHLLDRHGTGRVLFRNTRAAVKGFPKRKLSTYRLPLPKAYEKCIATEPARLLFEAQLSPEMLYSSDTSSRVGHWTGHDPRVQWLAEKLDELRPNKVLVIASNAVTALDLAQALKTRNGIHAAVFHEGLSIIKRDRAAAYFADAENGSQVLICSEIGSEGRNFQFAHQLVLFDLPLNPDLLEQRIGRLDRIGQTHTICIHVPYLADSAQAVMVQWYQDGLDAFESTCPTGQAVFAHVEMALLEAISKRATDVSSLLDTTQSYQRELIQMLHRGRDRLLEHNSYRADIAIRLQQDALRHDQDPGLTDYMDAAFDCFGVDTELHSESCYIARPGTHMISPFPGLSDDGITLTYSRQIALANEDMQFITWEHPMVDDTMQMVQSSEMGNTAVTAVPYAQIESGTVVLECLYILEPASSTKLQTQRYLPPTVVRVVMDEKGNQHHSGLSSSYIRRKQVPVDSGTANKIVALKGSEIRSMLSLCEEQAQRRATETRARALDKTAKTLHKEIDRLRALRLVNSNVRLEEVEFFQQELQDLTEIMASTSLRLDAVRVIVVA